MKTDPTRSTPARIGSRPVVALLCAAALAFAFAPASGTLLSRAKAESRAADCGATSGYARSIWPGFKGCPTGLGQSDRIGARDAAIQWQTNASLNPTFPGQVGASPVIAEDGTIFVGTSEGYFKSFNPAGGMIQSTLLSGNVRAAAAVGADGTVYVTADYGGLFALDPKTLVRKWSYPTVLPGTIIYSSPAIGPDGTIYFADYAGFVYAINPNGTTKWPAQSMLGPVLSSPVLSRDGSVLYVGNQALTFRALNAQTGAVNWMQLQITGDTATAAIGANGTIYVASSKGIISALNPVNGLPYWNYLTLSVIHASPAIDPSGNIIIADIYGTVFSISPAGTLNWATPLFSRTSSTPTVDRSGVIYIGTGGTFRFSLGVIGNIVPGTKALQALDSKGKLLWSAPTGAGVASSAAISRGGTLYVGADDGYLYGIGTPTGQVIRPAWPEDAVLQTVSLNSTVACAGNPALCKEPLVQVKPPACANPDARFGKNVTGTASMSVLDHVALVDPSCGGHLCGINGDNAASYTQTQIASGEPALLSAPSDANASDKSMPVGATIGCTAIAPPVTCPIDPTTIDPALACTLDSDCTTAKGTNYRCASVCLNPAGTAVVTNSGTACTNPKMRCGQPMSNTDVSCMGNALPAVATTTVPGATLPSRTADYQNYRCHEVRECAEDGALLNDSTPTCIDPNSTPFGAPIACNVNQTAAQPLKAVVQAGPPAFATSDFFNLTDFTKSNPMCAIDQLGNAHASKTAGVSGTKNSATGGGTPAKNSNNWGVDFSPAFSAKLDVGPKAFGRFDPNANVTASWGAAGVAFGMSIPIFSVNAGAKFDSVCSQHIGLSAQLFGQSVSVVVGSDTGLDSSAAATNCLAAQDLLKQHMGNLKASMVRAQQIYTGLLNKTAPVPMTKAICTGVFPPDSTGKSSCDTLAATPANAAMIVNTAIQDYETRFNSLSGWLSQETSSIESAISTAAGRSIPSHGYSGRINLIDLGQRFAVRVVDAKFPIGPIALVLAIEGGGDWGLPGGLDYNMQFAANGTTQPGLYGGIDMGPSAGINVDIYMGAGITIGGLAGADVGIGGDIHLVDVSTPIVVTAGIQRDPTPLVDSRTPLVNWGAPGGLVSLKATVPVYRWSAKTSMAATANLTLLSGEIDARVRVYFAFFSKTWKKTIAKLRGYSPAPITFVEGAYHQPLVDLPSPMDALPQITFVTLPPVSAANFPSFTSWTTPAAGTPADLLGQLANDHCYPSPQ